MKNKAIPHFKFPFKEESADKESLLNIRDNVIIDKEGKRLCMLYDWYKDGEITVSINKNELKEIRDWIIKTLNGDTWIPAQEHKPAYNQKVIIFDTEFGIDYGGWFSKRFGWLHSDGTRTKNVTHWREMLAKPIIIKPANNRK